jgi:ankyrin repeat protein
MTDEVAAGIAAGQDVNARDQSGRTALHRAAENGHGGVTEALLKAGCNKDIQEKALSTPLDLAVRNKKESNGWTALHWAARQGHAGVAQALLKAGCNKDIQDEDGKLALEIAAYYGKDKVVGVLIGAGMAAGQDVNACFGWRGKTMLMCASEGGHKKSVRALIEKGASLEAVTYADVEAMGVGMAGMAAYAGPGSASMPAPHLSTHIAGLMAMEGAGEAMGVGAGMPAPGHQYAGYVAGSMARDAGAAMGVGMPGMPDPGQPGYAGYMTGLHMLMVGAGAEYGQTALHLAAMYGHGGVVEALLKAGCNKDLQDTSGRTALHWAAENGHGGVVEALLKAGCNKKIKNRWGRTAQQFAKEEGDDEMVALLKEHTVCGGRK